MKGIIGVLACLIVAALVAVAGVEAAEPVRPLTLETRLSIPSDDALPTGPLLLAGLERVGAEPADALSLAWIVRNPIFEAWEIALESGAGLIPDELLRGRERLTLRVIAPRPGHVYTSRLSFDPGTGALSLAVRDEAAGQDLIVDEFQLRPYGGELAPAFGEGGSAVRVAAAFVPVGFESRIVRREGGQAIPVREIDRRESYAVEVDAIQGGGLWRVVTGSEGDLRVLAEEPARPGSHLLSIPAEALSPGPLSLTIQYTEAGEVLAERVVTARVGLLRVGLADVAVDRAAGTVSGRLSIETDGAWPGQAVRLVADLVADRAAPESAVRMREVWFEQDLAEEAGSFVIPFQREIPLDEAERRLTLVLTPEVIGGLNEMASIDPSVERVVRVGEAPLLKEVYTNHFLIGLAQDRLPADLEHIVDHFNAVTPENALKWERVHPRPDLYAFTVPDQLIEDAEKRGMAVIGHTLVWHNQTPGWVFQSEGGGRADRETLLARMREHIHAVAGRYCDRILGWDVVNEALEDDGSLRKSPWLEIIGEDYIELAFRYAHEACPSAELYYNDYGLENEAKRRGAVRLVEDLKAKGVPIHGIGSQSHIDVESPSMDEIRRSIEGLAATGLKVMITELDMSAYRWTDRSNQYAGGLPPDVAERQAKRYGELFRIFREYSHVIDRVTFWGLTDRTSWKNNFPVRGRTDHPLLFDREGQYKPAFWAVVDP